MREEELGTVPTQRATEPLCRIEHAQSGVDLRRVVHCGWSNAVSLQESGAKGVELFVATGSRTVARYRSASVLTANILYAISEGILVKQQLTVLNTYVVFHQVRDHLCAYC